MITSVGNDAVSSCAAVRAGISRPGPLTYTNLDLDHLKNEPVTGHPVRPLADGFEGIAVHTLLARHALRDLIDNAKLARMTSSEWEKTALFVCVSPTRTTDPEDQSEMDAESDEEIPRTIASIADIGVPGAGTIVNRAGHAAVLLSAQQILSAFEKGEFERAIIVGVDSLVGEDEVAYLAEKGRLKTPDNPVGLVPGQAAAALLVEAEHACGARDAVPLAFLTRAAVERVRRIREDGLESDGSGLARAIAGALSGFDRSLEFYGDLNGEHWRAQEWGATLVQLKKADSGIDATFAEDHALILPAIELGDTGAASGAVSLCMATRAFVRGYARAQRAVVWSRSEENFAAAALIDSASGIDHRKHRG